MKLLTITAFALAALLTACTVTGGGGPSVDDFSTSETEFYSFQQFLPLPVATKAGDTLFRNPMLGIDVVEILADGGPVAAEPSFVLFVGIDTTTVTVQSGTYIYDIHPNQMLFWKLPKQSDPTLVEYSIPENTEVLEIRYRLVTDDSDPDPRVYTLTARRPG